MNDQQQIVELVGDATGKATDRLEALRASELRFEPAPLGNVLDRSCHPVRFVSVIEGDICAAMQKAEIAIGAESAMLNIEPGVTGKGAFEGVGDGLQVFRVDGIKKRRDDPRSRLDRARESGGIPGRPC